MSKQLPPILYKKFSTPLPYNQTLALKNRIYELQLRRREESPGLQPDVLLLLEHRPTYTSGRRQLARDMKEEETRLKKIGADWEATLRGGETTFHGPGQIVGYPMLDLGRSKMSVRDYICNLEKLLKARATAYGLDYVASEHTGLFLTPQEKMGSIGVRFHRQLTMHGFAYNVTDEPVAWFRQVVACGLADVRAISISEALRRKGETSTPTVSQEMDGTLLSFSEVMGRDLLELNESTDPELEAMLRDHDELAKGEGEWLSAPLNS